MNKALAMVEYKTVSSGMQAADIMVKTAEVDIIEATTVCPGKYMVLISGLLSAVKAAVAEGGQELFLRFDIMLGNNFEDFCLSLIFHNSFPLLII